MQAVYNPFSMKIHPEGHKIITIAGLVLICINLVPVFIPGAGEIIHIAILIASILLFVFTLNFFRFPKRNPTPGENILYSPADGKVVAIEKCRENEYFNSERLLVSIFMSSWDVHINWIPVSGSVRYKKYHPGKFLLAFSPKSSELNEQTSTVIDTARCGTLLIRQIAGFVARRLVTYPRSGEDVKQGEQLGFIKFGSRVDIFLPPDTQLNVELGEQVYGYHSIIAEL